MGKCQTGSMIGLKDQHCHNMIDKDWSCRVAEVREVDVVVSVVLEETNQKSSIHTFLHHKGRTRELVLREHMAYPHYPYS